MIVNVRVQPRARSARVLKCSEDLFKVYVTVPPEDGKANEAVCGLLADYFQTAKRAVTILSGVRSRNKKIQILTK